MQSQLQNTDTAITREVNTTGIKLRDKCLKPDATNDAALQAHQQMIAEKQATFGRAFAACLEARDYTVK